MPSGDLLLECAFEHHQCPYVSMTVSSNNMYNTIKCMTIILDFFDTRIALFPQRIILTIIGGRARQLFLGSRRITITFATKRSHDRAIIGKHDDHYLMIKLHKNAGDLRYRAGECKKDQICG